jgi:hypothetical protein
MMSAKHQGKAGGTAWNAAAIPGRLVGMPSTFDWSTRLPHRLPTCLGIEN